MTFLVQQTLLYAIPLMIVALAGVFAERSGIINLALEGIMIFGAFIGVLFVNLMQQTEVFAAAKAAGDWITLQGLELLAMAVAALFGALFSLLLSFASINLKADQTIGGTALNLMAPALVLFFIRLIANQNELRLAQGDAPSWFMIKKTTLGFERTADLGFFGNTFLHQVYLATYVCIILFVILSIILYRTRFGLRLRACGENPQAADSLGINVYKMRYAGTTISGALAGMGGAAATGAAVGLGAAAGIAANMANPRAPQRPLAQLVDVVSGESHSITSAQVTIGRERSVSDIALRDPNVSRRHAQLTFTGSDWSIEDLNSTNGTLVNNRRITRCPLRNGDLLTFGLSTFEFRG